MLAQLEPVRLKFILLEQALSELLLLAMALPRLAQLLIGGLLLPTFVH